MVDGAGADWGESGLRFAIRRPAEADEPTASASVRVAWDRRALWVLFEVADPTPTAAPAAAAGPELFQWDSVEVYVDGLGDRDARMGSDDFQVIIAPDGRYAVLQGDPLLLEIEALEVPKRERPALTLETAGRRRGDGYVVECAIPFAALGISPRDGSTIALDLALNDWLADHATTRQLRYDLETLRKLDHRPGTPPPDYTRNGLEAEAAAGLEARLYRPWSLAGSGDFGHPWRWRPLRLVGGPAFAERLVDRLGPAWTLAGGAASALLLVAGALAAEERRHRRRIAALLERIARIDAPVVALDAPVRPEPTAPEALSPAPAPVTAGPPAGRQPPVALDWLERAVERAAGAEEPFEVRALRAVRERLGGPLTPAELAAALCMSLRTLERHLSETLGCSPGELILAEKMREARRLLARGGLQVQEVARRVGYDDPAHFSRRFKAYFGIAPKAFAAAHERAA